MRLAGKRAHGGQRLASERTAAPQNARKEARGAASHLQVDEHLVKIELLRQHGNPDPLAVWAPPVSVPEQGQTRGQIAGARE